tara:strand:- start:635 stop:1189 length:555 start_codon:yes stop_codon:yes gene_type:complete
MIIFLNGPPGSGKDTIANIIGKSVLSIRDIKLSGPLKDCFREMFRLPPRQAKEWLNDRKEEDFAAGVTPRQFQIKLSEEFMKPLFGNDIFGQIGIRAIVNTMARHFTISDAGFIDEVEEIVKYFGKTQVKAIKISRPGHDYENDSRGYIDFDSVGIDWKTLDNIHDMELLNVQVERILREWELV